MTIAPTEWVTEAAIVSALNITRATVRAARPAVSRPSPHPHYQRAIEWPMSAVRDLAEKLALPWPAGWPATSVPPTAMNLPVVNRAPNPHIVNCRHPDGHIVPVRVVDNRKYVTNGGMTVPATKSPQGNWWVLVGSEPRWVGKW
jgi:hypothetical protein